MRIELLVRLTNREFDILDSSSTVINGVIFKKKRQLTTRTTYSNFIENKIAKLDKLFYQKSK